MFYEVDKMLRGLFDDVLDVTEEWGPKGKYPNENAYRDDLMEFLRERLNERSPLTIGPQKRIKVSSESGRHLCDIAIDEKIGIELKKDLRHLGDIDRLESQLRRFKRDYEDLIVVLVGETNENRLEEMKDRIERINEKIGGSYFEFQQGPRIELINKCSGKTEKGKEGEKSRKEIYDPLDMILGPMR